MEWYKYIVPYDSTVHENAAALLALQARAYGQEAKLIGATNFPPLADTIEDIKGCGEIVSACVADGELLGALGYIVDGSDIVVCRLVVSPEWFHKGIGSGLLEAVMASSSHAKRIFVTTSVGNDPAINFYSKRHGFSAVNDHTAKEGILLRTYVRSL